MKKVTTVVVTYNRKELLNECIRALLKQSYKNNEILIIDNASTDGTKEAIEKYVDNKKVFYINTGKNLGGAGGFNYGVREALKRKSDYVWLLDDDTIAKYPNALEAQVQKANVLKDEFSFLSSITLWTDGKPCVMNRQDFENDWAPYEKQLHEGLIPIKTSTFVGFFANAAVVKKVGLPIKEFFIYYDDIEYAYRMRKVKPAFLNTDSLLLHKMKTNSGGSAITVPADRIKRAYYNHRNLGYIVRHHYNKRERKYGYKHKFFQNAYYVLVVAKDHKIKRLWALTRGTIAGKFFNPKVEMK